MDTLIQSVEANNEFRLVAPHGSAATNGWEGLEMMEQAQQKTAENGCRTDGGQRLQFEGENTESSGTPDLRQCVQDVITAAMDFAQVRVDAVRIRLQSLALRVGIAILAAAAVTVLLVVSSVLLLNGLSGGIAHWLRTPAWTGHLIVGTICVGLPALVIGLYARRIQKKWLNELRNKYGQELK